MSDDSSFSTFMFGLTLGVVGTVLLGTEEGRKVTRRLMQSAGETLEKNEGLIQEAKNVASQAVREIENQFVEPPPPPPPYTGRPRTAPTFFHEGEDSRG